MHTIKAIKSRRIALPLSRKLIQARGELFLDICALTRLFSGNIVYCTFSLTQLFDKKIDNFRALLDLICTTKYVSKIQQLVIHVIPIFE